MDIGKCALWLAKNMGSKLIDLALENKEPFRKWLESEADKTTNPIDDLFVDTAVEWFEGLLIELKGKL